MRMLGIGLTFSASFYVFFLLLAYLLQRSLMYLPSQDVPAEHHISKMGFEAVEIDAGEIGSLRSLWRAPRKPDGPVILHFHGNGGSIYNRIPIYQDIASEGAGVLAAGYPGYGGNPGSPGETAFFRTAQANYDWLKERSIDPARIVIFGESIGSGSATWLVVKNDAAGLILEAPFTGADDIAARQIPILPVRWLLKDRFRNIERIDRINMPLVWIHGLRDSIIPFASGQQLFDAASEPKSAFPIENGDHNDLWSKGIGQIVRAQAQLLVAARKTD